MDTSIRGNLNTLKQLFTVGLLTATVYCSVFSILLPQIKEDISPSGEIRSLYNTISNSTVQIYDTLDGYGATGSGVYIAPHYLVTNNHVIDGAINGVVSIVAKEGIFHGQVIAAFPGEDLALVKTDGNIGTPVKLGSGNEVSVGDLAVSVGASYGYRNTLGVGYVTGLNRFVPLAPFSGIISVSTGIMPGNSGGGVYNRRAELIGISYAGVRMSDNLGFVIPVSSVVRLFGEYL